MVDEKVLWFTAACIATLCAMLFTGRMVWRAPRWWGKVLWVVATILVLPVAAYIWLIFRLRADL